MKNEITVKNDNLMESTKSKIFCSVVADTEESKKALFNALEECDALLNNCEGQEINIKDIYIECYDKVDEKTGEVKVKYRTIIFDVSGQTYATASYGIYNIFKKIIAIYGMPTWEEGIKVKVAKRPIGQGKSTLTLTLV